MMRSPVHMLLGVLIAAALASAAWPWLRGGVFPVGNTSATVTLATPPPRQEPFAPPWWRELPPLEEMRETTRRPLFTASRRPQPPRGQRRREVAGLAGYVLAGVVIAGNTRIAMLRSRTGAGNLRVRVGDKVAGWTVAAIDSRSVTVRRDGEQRRIVAAK